jgi:hypothetical protein
MDVIYFTYGATIRSPSLSHAATLLVVHGQVAVRTKDPRSHINLSGGMGGVLRKDERYSLTSETGAIIVIIEAEQLTAHPGASLLPSASTATRGQVIRSPKPISDRCESVHGRWQTFLGLHAPQSACSLGYCLLVIRLILC